MRSNLLEVRNLRKSFSGLKAIKDVSFDVREGQILGIIGPNGSGKSTLVNLITGITSADHGRVVLNGQNICGLRPSEIVKRGLSRTFQSTRVFAGLSVRENLQIGAWMHRIPDAEVSYELDRLGLKKVESHLAENLSYGDRKMLELGISLIGRPALILLDEPLAGVHESVVRNVSRLMRETKGTTFVVIEHNVPFVTETCERVLVLNEGELLADGSPYDVKNDPKVMAAYLGSGSHLAKVKDYAKQ